MRIYINNTWQEFDILKAPPIKTAIDDSLDTATVIFHSNFKEAIEKNTFIEINNKIMCVYNDQSVPISKYNNKWQHTLSLIETTHLLDLIFCTNICLTNREETLNEEFVKLTENIGFFSNSFISSMQIHSDLKEALNGLNSVELYCINSTARECFDDLLKTINARIELIAEYSQTSNMMFFWLNYRSGAKRNNLVSFNKMSSLYTYDSNTMTNNITFIGQNAVPRYPITQGYEGFKTTEPILTTENAQMILMHEIEDIVSLKVKYRYTYNIQIDFIDTTIISDIIQRTFDVEIDLTEFLIEQEAYDLLTSEEQQTKIPYSRNNIINTGSINLIRTLLFGTGNKMVQIAQQQGYIKVQNNINDYMMNDEEYPPSYDYDYNVLDVIIVPLKIENMLYQITYYPFLNVYGNVTKNANKKDNFTIVDNQQEEVLSLEKYSDLLENKIKRIGNMEIEIDEVNQPIKKLNDYTEDGYVIYEREIAQSINEVKVHYKLSKNYNLLNNRIAVDQKKRLFEIPLNYQDCYLTHKKKIYVDFIESQSPEDETFTLKDTILKTLNGDFARNDTEVRGVWFETKKENEKINTLFLYCSAYVLNNGLHFSCLMYDNYSSALSVGGQVLGGKKAIYNPYCDSNGEFDELTYALCRVPTNKTSELLLYPSGYIDVTKVTDETKINFHKDRSQRICLDICVEVDSLNEDIILGKEFFQNNRAIKNSKTPKLYFWYSEDEVYTKDTLKALGTKHTEEIDTIFNYVYNVSKYNYEKMNILFNPTNKQGFENVKSWCIADENGNIYLAVNGELKPIYFI